MDDVVTFLIDHWAGISTALFLLSEALASIPSVQANSVFQMIWGILKKVAPVKQSAIVLLCLMLGLAACSGKQVKISRDAQRIMVEGCDGLQTASLAYDVAAPFLTEKSDVQEKAELSQDAAKALCDLVKAQQPK